MDPRYLEQIFQTPLRNADISERFTIPNNHMNHVWGPNDPLQRTFHVEDLSGASWDLEGRIIHDQEGLPKLEVYGHEWRRFARRKSLRVGDTLVFFHHPDPASRAVCVLSIDRETTLMGARFSSYVNLDSNI